MYIDNIVSKFIIGFNSIELTHALFKKTGGQFLAGHSESVQKVRNGKKNWL